MSANKEMTHNARRALLETTCQLIETAEAYEKTARYHQAATTRDRAMWHLEQIGLRNLMVKPEVT